LAAPSTPQGGSDWRPSERAISAEWFLRKDLVTGEIVSALQSSGVPTILLKGPSFRHWLYDNLGERWYADIDLLVRVEDVARAGAVLRRFGFEHDRWAGMKDARPSHAEVWSRMARTQEVDLHHTIDGVMSPPSRLWDVLTSLTTVMDIGGVDVQILSVAARCMHSALHAAEHGVQHPVVIEDLRRALRRAPVDVWADAGRIARDVEAGGAFAAGLRILPEGERVLEDIGWDLPPSVDALLASGPRSGFPRAIERLSRIPGPSRRAAFFFRKLFPKPDYLRRADPVIGPSPLGLLKGYVRRLQWALTQLVPSYRAWRRARKVGR
jgi:hypothetical protein